MAHSSDEIDFEPVLAKIYSTFTRFFSSIFNFFPFVLKNILKIGLFSIIGAVIGFSLTMVVKPYFKVTMSLSTGQLGSLFTDVTIDELNLSIKQKNYTTLAKNLGITAEEAEHVKKLYSTQTNVFMHYGDTNKNEFIYYINADLYSEEIIDKLDVGIISFLESNEFSKKSKKMKEFHLKNSIDRLEQEVVAIDSIIKKVENNIGEKEKNKSNTIILNETINPVELIKQKDEFSTRLLMFKNQLSFVNNYLLIKRFNATYKPYFPKKSIFTLIGLLVGFLAAVVFIKSTTTKS